MYIFGKGIRIDLDQFRLNVVLEVKQPWREISFRNFGDTAESNSWDKFPRNIPSYNLCWTCSFAILMIVDFLGERSQSDKALKLCSLLKIAVKCVARDSSFIFSWLAVKMKEVKQQVFSLNVTRDLSRTQSIISPRTDFAKHNYCIQSILFCCELFPLFSRQITANDCRWIAGQSFFVQKVSWLSLWTLNRLLGTQNCY